MKAQWRRVSRLLSPIFVYTFLATPAVQARNLVRAPHFYTFLAPCAMSNRHLIDMRHRVAPTSVGS